MKISSLGFPRIGRQRELKFALERYWRAEISLFELKQVASELKKTHWQWQADAGVELVPVGDFAYYDQVLTLSATLNVIPDRHRATQADGSQAPIDIDTLFRVARGRSQTGQHAYAAEMTKFFEKGLMGSVFYYQIAHVYFGESKIDQWHQICLLNGMSSRINAGITTK